MLTPVPRSRVRRLWWLLAAGGLLLIALTAVFVATEHGRIAHGVRIAGANVGGLTNARARVAVATQAERLRRQPIRVVAAGTVIVTSGHELGATPRIDDAVRLARRRVGIVDRIRSRVGLGKTRAIPLTFDLDDRRVAALVLQLEQRVARPPRDAELIITDDAQIVPARPGRSIATSMLVAALRQLPATLIVPTVETSPRVTTGQAIRARHGVNELLSRPRAIARGSRTVTVTPEELRRLLVISTAGRRIAIALDADALTQMLRPVFGVLERPPKSAAFRIRGQRVVVTPSRNGLVLDGEAIGRSLVSDLRSTTHRARLRVREPIQTTARLRALRIRELVSEFTTPYPCCAPRVTNIKRAAEILDGGIIRPRQTFSLNKRLGKRTTERGFVSAPQIYDGRLNDAVGGGVSQVATTLYNAAFFAGLRLDRHTPHQFYISRYPMGREATVSWGGPELVFTNDWPAAILMKIDARETSLTVRFYSSKLDRRVETTTGEPKDYLRPTTRVVHSETLPAGARRVVQEAGPPGFVIEYTRKVFQGPRLRRSERFRVRYDPENEIAEVGPKHKQDRPPSQAERTAPDSKALDRSAADR